MCWLCDHPNADGDAEDDLDGLRSAIRDHLWVVKCVEDERRPYAYTLGLHELGLPELLATGVTTERALALMDYFAPEAIQNGAPAPGDRIAMAEDAMFEAVEVDQPDVIWNSGQMLFGPKLRAVQLVWTDRRGRWPWDADVRLLRDEAAGAGVRAAPLRTRSGGTAPCSATTAPADITRGHHAVVPGHALRTSRSRTGDSQASRRTPGTALMMSSGPLIPQYSVAPDRRTTAFIHCDLMPSRLKASNCSSPDGNVLDEAAQ